MNRRDQKLKILYIINKSNTIEEAITSIETYCNVYDDMAFLDKYYTGIGRWDRKIMFNSGHAGKDKSYYKFNLGRYLNDSYFVQKKLKQLL